MLTIGAETVLTVDADAHVVESEQTWDYLEPSEQQFRPVLVGARGDTRGQYWVLNDRIMGFRNPNQTARELEELSEKTGRELRTEEGAREMARVDLRLEHMRQIGIDIQVLHNTLWITRVTDRADAEVALCRSYNRWLAEIWRLGKGRLRWTCLPPTLSLPDAIDEVRWSKQHGAVGICIRPLEGERNLVDPYFYPLYEEAQRLDMPLAVHISNGNPTNVDLVRPNRTWQFRVPTVGGFIAYMASDLYKLFPKLRVGFIEAGSLWLPWALQMSVRNKQLRPDQLDLPQVLREHNVWITCENEDDLPYILKYPGEDTLVIGTDYGHTDPSSNLRALNQFAAHPELSNAVKKKILRDNALAFYEITEEETRHVVPQEEALAGA